MHRDQCFLSYRHTAVAVDDSVRPDENAAGDFDAPAKSAQCRAVFDPRFVANNDAPGPSVTVPQLKVQMRAEQRVSSDFHAIQPGSLYAAEPLEFGPAIEKLLSEKNQRRRSTPDAAPNSLARSIGSSRRVFNQEIPQVGMQTAGMQHMPTV